MSNNPSDFFAKSETLRRARTAGMVDLSYNIQINEHQRALIHKLMASALENPKLVLELLNDSGNKMPASKNTLDEAAYLVEQFGANLVNNESAMPGVTHSLCF
jgi:hypothetical protein